MTHGTSPRVFHFQTPSPSVIVGLSVQNKNENQTTERLKKMMCAILKGKMRLAALTICIGLIADVTRAETKGFWFFGGGHQDQEIITAGTVIPNQVAGSDMVMTFEESKDPEEGSVRPSYYTTGTPTMPLPRSAKPMTLYANANLTESIGKLDSALYLSLNASNTESGKKTAGCLRATNFGKAVIKNGVIGDFTMEILCKMPGTSTSAWSFGHEKGNMIGLSPAASLNYSKPTPVFAYTDFNGGVLQYSKDEDTIERSGWIDSSSSFSQNKGKWALYVFVYTAADTKMTCYIRNNNGVKGYSTYSITYQSLLGKPIPIDADSYLQVGGPMGAMLYGLPSFHVGAVRVSDKALAEQEWMTLASCAEDYADNPLVGWWRFENSTAGGTFSICPNERTDLSDSDGIFTRDWMALRAANSGWDAKGDSKHWDGISGVYFNTPKKYVSPKRSESRALVPNMLCVGAANVPSTKTAETEYRDPIKLYVPNIPDAYLPGSFTAEEIVCLPTDATISGNGFARNTVLGRVGAGIWDSYDFKTSLFLRTQALDGSEDDIIRGSSFRWSFGPDEWHHVAFVYDAEKRQALLYVDYQLVQTADLKDGYGFPEPISPTGALTTGWCEGGSAFHWLGSNCLGAMGAWGYVDEARITRGVLTRDEFLKTRTGNGLFIVVQ